MICLGIESTAHTFGVGIVDSKGNILANVKDSYTSDQGGMIPDLFMDHHKEVCEDVLKRALSEAKITWDDVSFIAYSAGPGIDPCLWTGYHIVKKWSEQYNKKIT